MAEPCILAGLFITLSMLLPLAFPCTPTHCIIVQGEDLPRCPAGESDHMRYVAIRVSSGDCWAGAFDHMWLPMSLQVSAGQRSLATCGWRLLMLDQRGGQVLLCRLRPVCAWECSARQHARPGNFDAWVRALRSRVSWVSVLAVRPEAGARSCGLLVLILPATQATSAMPPTFPACVTESMLAPMTQMWSRADWQCYRRVVEDSLELYTCRPGSSDSEIPASASNDTALGSYNELATLMTVTGGPALPPNPV